MKQIKTKFVNKENQINYTSKRLRASIESPLCVSNSGCDVSSDVASDDWTVCPFGVSLSALIEIYMKLVYNKITNLFNNSNKYKYISN